MSLLLAFLAGGVCATVVVLLIRRGSGAPSPELDDLRQAVHELHLEQQRDSGELRGLVQAFAGQQEQLVRQTGQLSEALRRPGVRGQWGERTLRQVVEAAGLAEHFDFDTHIHRAGDEDRSAARPDLVVHLPGGGCVPIDAKVPLDAYLDAAATEIPSERERALDEHVRQVRAKVRDLSAKAYWSRFDRAPEMVVMFIPSEAAFAAAAQRDHDLLADAATHNVVIATPATMLALLQIVQLGWREHAFSANAEKVRTLATELISRLATFTGHLAKVGKALEQAATAHNQAVGSLESRVLSTARKFEGLGVAGELPELQLVATVPRLPSAVADAAVALTGRGNGVGEAPDRATVHGSATAHDATVAAARVTELWCAGGQHPWTRAAQPDPAPASCPDHT